MSKVVLCQHQSVGISVSDEKSHGDDTLLTAGFNLRQGSHTQIPKSRSDDTFMMPKVSSLRDLWSESTGLIRGLKPAVNKGSSLRDLRIAIIGLNHRLKSTVDYMSSHAGHFAFVTIAAIGLMLSSTVCYASEGKDINISELIFEHTNDAYEWHLVTLGQSHIAIPLPVIVYSQPTGLNVFMSSKLKDNNSYRGFSYGSHEGNYAGKIVEKTSTGEEYRPIDISITKDVVSLFVTVAILLLCVLLLARWYKKHGEYETPRGFMGALDMLITEIHEDVIKKCIGHNYKRYAPYLLTVFFFILISNLLGLIPIFPGGANLTGNIAVTFILALCTFVLVNVSGTKEYWKEIVWPNVPVWMKIPLPLLPVVEIFGVFTKPFALMIRLFANVLAGHAVMIGLCCIIFMTASLGLAVNSVLSFVAILIMIFMSFIELLVAVVQAYVFTLLSAVFISLAQAQPHKQHN